MHEPGHETKILFNLWFFGNLKQLKTYMKGQAAIVWPERPQDRLEMLLLNQQCCGHGQMAKTC